MTVDLKTIKLDDILARLDETEQNVSVLTSSTSAGWQPSVAWNPVETFEVKYDETIDPTPQLEEFVAEQQGAGRLIIGYVSYDFGCLLHGVKLSTDDDLKTPLVYAQSFDNWITFDDNKSIVHAKNVKFNDELTQIMARPLCKIPLRLYDKGLSSAWPKASYNRAYELVHDYIEAGDIYQANLTHRLEGTVATSGLDIYRKVSRSSHADFQSYIGGTNFEIISASPERFVRIYKGQIETSPIKGTRPRGNDNKQDAAIRADLETNPKDKAELDMITDLMRNDLGAISEIGSVIVTERRVLTSYPTLWHAHSTIKGRLKSDISPIAALASLMPGGSITGCPKKRAMEIIDEVEAKRRGIYTGSIFTIKPNGELDSNIAIRTMIKKSNSIYLSIGGGIVYDSKQADEYEESLQKAAAFLKL
jgi:para-aminobenzoate synthetase component 1